MLSISTRGGWTGDSRFPVPLLLLAVVWRSLCRYAWHDPYIDSSFKCHTSTAEGLTQIETDAFDGKCDAYIEGYRYIPAGQTWTRADGVVFTGEMIAPWKPWAELDTAQREYEREQYQALAAQNAEYEAALSEIETALGVNA